MIGTLNEGSLHATLKLLYAEPGDEFEVKLDGFVIDIKRDDLLIEIQTSSLGALGRKLDHLLPSHSILLVHPIAVETRLIKPGAKPRRSPKRGTIYSLFDELVSVPTLLDHPNLQLEVVLASVDKLQINDPTLRRRRGGWRTVDRRLDTVIETRRFNHLADLAELLPSDLPPEFTTADIASQTPVTRSQAQKMAYCFRSCEVFETIDRNKTGYVYRIHPRFRLPETTST